MTNSRAGRSLVKLDNHLATGTESTYTYTGSLNMLTTYSEIIVTITGTVTAALVLEMKLNALTDYNNTILRGDTTTLSTEVNDALGHHSVVASGLLDGAVPFTSRTIITAQTLAAGTTTMNLSSRTDVPHEGQSHSASSTVANTNPITSIIIETSTSTWAANTQIHVYGVLR